MHLRATYLYVCLMLPIAASANTTRPLLPLQTGSARFSLPVDPDHFTFVLSGDNRAAGRGVPMPPTLDRICTEIALVQPAFTLWTGDAIYGSDETTAEADAEYTTFLKSAAKAFSPIYNAPGNHEIFDRADMEALYQKRMGMLYGSFDYGNSHFIAIDTEDIGLKGGVGKDQLAWLEQDLESNRNAAHIFAFMHHPMFPKPGEKEGWDDSNLRDRVHRLFLKYGVKNVFSGHEHLYYHGVKDGINYYVSGGAGAPLDASPEDGGYQHYVLFTVDGDKVTPAILQPWRLFAGHAAGSRGPAELVSNYNNSDVSVCVALHASGKYTIPAAVSQYKGKSKQLDAKVVSSPRSDAILVRVTIPAHRSAIVSLEEAK